MDTRARWEKAAAEVLRKTGRLTPEDPDTAVWSQLSRSWLEGIDVLPLATAGSVEGLPETGEPGQAPFTRGSQAEREEGWDIRAHLAEPDPKRAAEDALNDLENGVTSLLLSVGAGGTALEDLPTVLDKVFLDLAPVVLDSPQAPLEAARALVALLEERVISPAPGTGFGADPLSQALRSAWAGSASLGGLTANEITATITALGELARPLGINAVTVDATAAHDAGGHIAHELGWSLAVGAAYLRALTSAGWSAAEAAATLEFRYSATDEQFATIAKFRAARLLWHRVCQLCEVASPVGQVQHAITSRPMTTSFDPWVNMLRGTVAAFAAGAGGAASVTVLPFDAELGLPDELARRNARNTSSLLIHEAHIGKVLDPAGGSYAVERLTHDLAEASWAVFTQIEAEGGALAALPAFLSRIHAEAEEPRERQIATRKRPITGVSEFPNLGEELPVRRQGGVEVPHLRYAQAFEDLRRQPAAAPVFLATLGAIAAHTARATFAANLLGAGGVHTESAGATADADELTAAYQAAGSPRVVCLAGSDGAYAQWGAEAAHALRTAGATHLILAGQPGPAGVSGDLVDDFCAVGIDAPAFLSRTRKELSR